MKACKRSEIVINTLSKIILVCFFKKTNKKLNLDVLNIIAHSVLSFIYDISYESKHQAEISARNKCNIFDSFKALSKLYPFIGKHISSNNNLEFVVYCDEIEFIHSQFNLFFPIINTPDYKYQAKNSIYKHRKYCKEYSDNISHSQFNGIKHINDNTKNSYSIVTEKLWRDQVSHDEYGKNDTNIYDLLMKRNHGKTGLMIRNQNVSLKSNFPPLPVTSHWNLCSIEQINSENIQNPVYSKSHQMNSTKIDSRDYLDFDKILEDNLHVELLLPKLVKGSVSIIPITSKTYHTSKSHTEINKKIKNPK